ncbi:hypothetical protein EG68_11557 [Paragonimus skrjabini miyazakii]|uniref:ATP synthase subunit b n=1 Tax=Paragonimus skrjabini miyazakii TaxID=59628 RepID=A0A8S9YC63_9TREM|nr:hypothetical protein EG68_11557 [Paragonimus skrjabini miyazakii]
MAFFSSGFVLSKIPVGKCLRCSRLHFSNGLKSTSGTNTPSGAADYVKKSEELANKYTKHIDDAVNRWAKCDEIYSGKERDFQRFPAVKYPLTHPKVRLGFLPDSWFQALYPKTGVTGPYLFLFGTSAFLISKEIWVVDPHFIELGVFVIVMTGLIKKFGPSFSKYLDKQIEEVENTRYYQPLKALNSHLDRMVATADQEIARASAVASLVNAKVENVELQLEAAYRERLQQVYRAVHRRLDYHVERENTRRRFQQQHMVNWVVDQVVRGITPVQEKETLSQCIMELRRLSQLNKTATMA